MAAKRFTAESGSDLDEPTEKRMRGAKPSFISVIGDAVIVNSLQSLFSALEPTLRRVVKEELENSLERCSRSITRSPSLRIQAPGTSCLQLVFNKKLEVPIFTGSKIVDMDKGNLQIFLVDTRGDQMVPTSLPQSIKVEVVVLDGDFPSDDRNGWSSDEFEKKIVKERTGKRPLLAGDCLMVSLKNGFAGIGEIEFTDNSSWIRSRKFRIGARVAPGSQQGVGIREAITEAFVVKDHRGELYKKHHPPQLEDEVWRLEKIGKDGAFHKKLTAKGILTVQDFLKLSIVDPAKLRRILGAGMSEKMWDVTIKHARTCEMGNKHYVFRVPNCILTLNPICQVIHATINGHAYSSRDLSTINNRGYIENLVRQAHQNWRSLEEIIVGASCETGNLLTQAGELEDEQSMVKSFHHQTAGYLTDGYIELQPCSNAHIGCNNWQMTSTYHVLPIHGISESSSDGEITPPGSYINGT